MKKRLPLIITICLVSIGIVLAIVFIGRAAPEATPSEIAVVTRGDILRTVLVDGNLEMPRKSDLLFGTVGTVTDVLVNKGDTVAKGQVLARLDARSLELSVEMAQAQVEMAQAQVEIAEAQVEPVQIQVEIAQAQVEAAQAQVEIAEAQVETVQAQVEIAEAQVGPVQIQVETAQTQVEIAQAQVEVAQAQLKAAQVQVEIAHIQVETARAQYDRARELQQDPDVAGNFTELDVDTARANLDAAKKQVDMARANLDAAKAQVDIAKANLDVAKKQVDIAKANLDVAEKQVDIAKANLNVAERQVNIPEANMETAKRQVDIAKANLNVAKRQVDIPKANLETAELNFQAARLNLEKALIVAPFDAIVADITIIEGKEVLTMTPATPAISLVDTTDTEMRGFIDELDIAIVKLSQEANIILDALPDKVVKGRVTFISPTGTVRAGVVFYEATITLENPDEELRDGMSATAEIIIERRDDVLLIPNRAIRGTWENPMVAVDIDGQVEERQITLGLSDGINAEVLSGLKERERVVLPAPGTQPRGFFPH